MRVPDTFELPMVPPRRWVSFAGGLTPTPTRSCGVIAQPRPMSSTSVAAALARNQRDGGVVRRDADDPLPRPRLNQHPSGSVAAAIDGRARLINTIHSGKLNRWLIAVPPPKFRRRCPSGSVGQRSDSNAGVFAAFRRKWASHRPIRRHRPSAASRRAPRSTLHRPARRPRRRERRA